MVLGLLYLAVLVDVGEAVLFGLGLATADPAVFGHGHSHLIGVAFGPR